MNAAAFLAPPPPPRPRCVGRCWLPLSEYSGHWCLTRAGEEWRDHSSAVTS